MTEITVSRLYEGIPGIAHGGYTAGLLAEQVADPVRVLLRQPPPLDTPMAVEHIEGGVALSDPAGRRILEARPAEQAAPTLPAVTVEEARARPPHPGFAHHPYPVCFVCGTRQDGFNVRVSAPDEDGLVVGVWIPSGALMPAGDEVPRSMVWAVVDCVTAWSFAHRWSDAAWHPAVTGQIAVTQAGPLRRGEPCALVGRLVERQGRRITVEAAFFDPDGSLCAHGEATWVVLRDP